ncbi:potassium-transporting ATPase subunit F [Mycolicibacterium austroafricanum]|nr:potassium-transporting ATPase subunit F [Mycolicibacterium austroafricanum]QZT60151.1 potassium-transporting ATPase subunit F [Mycolicibacterium austroafricanum]QZT71518.1 potassium-transporting ATPase subunit F [Mycolicibacterium austroafricanum]QZY49252.1 potassium-transporting ATPase subunit F [Mycolicibacterium austroafricanum]
MACAHRHRGGCVNERRRTDNRDLRGDLHRADGGDLRRPRRRPEVGGESVTQNLIGLALAALIAVFLFAALLFPERF